MYYTYSTSDSVCYDTYIYTFFTHVLTSHTLDLSCDWFPVCAFGAKAWENPRDPIYFILILSIHSGYTQYKIACVAQLPEDLQVFFLNRGTFAS